MSDLKLDPEETQSLNQLKKQAHDLINEIGQIEVRKAQRLSSLADLEDKAQSILNLAAKRFNIPPGTHWQTTPAGDVIVLDTNGQPTTLDET
tara:strand:+ start:485 stop:760 length:276 start_codon:yes stop_codon:yes gene_type:complete